MSISTHAPTQPDGAGNDQAVASPHAKLSAVLMLLGAIATGSCGCGIDRLVGTRRHGTSPPGGLAAVCSGRPDGTGTVSGDRN
jgi:hypothetical protein